MQNGAPWTDMDGGIGIKWIQECILTSYQYTLTALLHPTPDERAGKQTGRHPRWSLRPNSGARCRVQAPAPHTPLKQMIMYDHPP
jgi:hypothetical protein